MKKDPCIIVTSLARLSFPKLWEADGYKGQPPKFRATFIFPGPTEDDIPKELKRAVRAAKIKQWGEDKTKWPKLIAEPFHFGNEDKPDVEGYKDCNYITASNKHRPEVKDRKLRDITEESGELQAGHYVRADLRAYAYTDPKPGVTFSLESVMKIKDGPTFSGKRKASEAFAEFVVDEDEDLDNDNGSDEDDDGGF